MATATRIKWPAIPAIVEGAGGPITVRKVKRARSDDGRPCWGTWEMSKREIQLDRSASREHQTRTYFHELVHAALDDAGIAYLLSEEGAETICEAVASARMRELRGRLVNGTMGRR